MIIDEAVKDKLEKLPINLRKEVLDYIEFLSKKYGGGERKAGFKFDWEDGLSELKGKYTSVELQHKALEWR